MAKKPEELPRIIVGGNKSPTQLGGVLGKYVPPGAQYEYTPPSVFAQHRLLTILFAVLAVAGLAYGVLVHKGHDENAAPAPAVMPSRQSKPDDPDAVYVQPIAPR